ncbi:MAG: GGDEF domain-containing protein [Onishia taeanensis]|uniref:GGDEF domain-containing protein n=1 Tax=Onishia taeanensis TaxID=284577 RepID=UPI003C7C8654
MSQKDPLPPLVWDPRKVQISGFTTGVYQIEWLLVSLVIFHLVVVGSPQMGGMSILVGTTGYFLFSLLATRLKYFDERRRWLLTLHTLVMVGFITWFLHGTSGVQGPMGSLYLLAVVTSALTLGATATLLLVGLIAACYLLLFQLGGGDLLSAEGLIVAGSNLVVFLITGYLTAVLVDAIHLSNRMLLNMATRDSLTDMLNRRAFFELVTPFHADGVRYRRPFSVVIIDMDDLKAINDRDGHAVGDRALLAVASCLEDCKRDSDLVARLGGDEFGMFLPNTDEEGAIVMLERLLERAEDELPRISVGVASYPQHGKKLATLMEHADHAMYSSKAAGGHRVSLSSEPQQLAS